MTQATVTYDTDHFRIESEPGALNFFTGDIAGRLGLDTDNAKLYTGVPAETIGASLSRLVSTDWYWLTVGSVIYADATNAQAVATWIGTAVKQLIIDNIQPGVLTTDETTSIAAKLSVLESDRVSVMWSRAGDYKAVSLAARFSSVDFEAANSLITAKFKQLIGTKSDDITTSQKLELDRKRINHYSPYGGADLVAEGWTLNSSTWMDVRLWLDWFVVTVASRCVYPPTLRPWTRAANARRYQGCTECD